ncbi:IniB N-terminal domain-containing protein [Amycolatopsis sp. cg5]|uniref:IniB N-terminal domain-containing protein n=1 Tax=Amycolatopsis sp. cg5 TaxID=3238802 RepID=UPI0035239EFB
MIQQPTTLHDFVYNLLTDDVARSAFGADPSAALAGAGLHDVTPQDVQEVVPLVLDYAPAGVNLPVGTDSGSVIDQLTAVAKAGSLPKVDTADAGSFGGGVHGASPVGDYEASLIADTTGYAAGGSLTSPAGDFGLETGGDFADFGIPAVPAVPSLPGVPAFPGVPAVPTIPNAPADPRFDLPADPAGQLDGALDKVSAGTIASYVAGGGDAFGDVTGDSATTLGEYLTRTGVPAADHIAPAGGQVEHQIHEGTHAVTDQIANAPIPDAGALPAVPGVPAGLPTDLPQLPHLPVDLPQVPHLPVDLPHLPVANPLPHTDVTHTVTDTVSHSPLGDVASPVHDALPHAVDAPTDLLGH